MKYTMLLAGFILLLAACNNSGKSDESVADTVFGNQAWRATLNDSSGKMDMEKTIIAGPDSLTTTAVIRFLNTRNPNVQLQFVKQSGDTLYISIPESTYLTQQMGSTGAEMYLAESVYNLTEIPGIHNVRYDFEEGDHAEPGVYNRDSFKGE